MTPMLAALELAAALIAVSPPAAVPSAPPFPAARPVVPFVKHAEVDCDWTISDPAEQWIRGSIGGGSEEPSIHLVDSVFYSWSDSEYHEIEVSVGDPAHRVPASGAWASNAGGQTPGSIGFYLNADLRKLIGGATSLQIWKAGKPVFNAVLAGTPSQAELDACVGPPESESTDVE